jgi:phosphatidylethanolamine-binding protein (PEBP) family uncharacterized protein
LTRPAKTASAGILLALAAAAFLLAGCGGGSSSDSSASTAAEGSSASAGGSAGSGANGAGGAGGGAASGKEASGKGGSTSGEGGGGTSSGGKHGPPVPQPKGEREPGITPQQRKEATVADMAMQSPSAIANGSALRLPVQYGCHGSNTSPALVWKGVPPGTAELVLFAMNIQPVEENLFFDWAVAGLSPELEDLEAGKLPKGAVVGRNSFGETSYGLCPEHNETYMFALFAVPKKLSPSRGFEPLALRKEVLDSSGDVGLLALEYAPG